MKNLPYDFDLIYDVKTMEDVEIIAEGEPHRSNANVDDLIEHKMNKEKSQYLVIDTYTYNNNDVCLFKFRGEII